MQLKENRWIRSERYKVVQFDFIGKMDMMSRSRE